MKSFKENPCLCINLKLGTILVATVEILISLVMACLATVTLTYLAVLHTNNFEFKELPEEFAKHPEYGTLEEPKDMLIALYVIMSLTILKAITEIICTAVLIFGARQERLQFLKYWLIIKASCTVFGSLLALSNLSLRPANERRSLLVTLGVTKCFLGIYFIFVVYRLYMDLWSKNLNVQRRRPRLSVNANAPQQV